MAVFTSVFSSECPRKYLFAVCQPLQVQGSAVEI